MTARVLYTEIRPNPVRVVIGWVDGTRHEIPEGWFLGACRTRSSEEALRHWHEQVMLEQDALQQYAINQRWLRGEIDAPTHDAGMWS